MVVTVLERLILLGMMPKEGNIITLKLVRDLKDEIGFSDEELVALDLKQADEGRRTVWNVEAAERLEKDIDFGIKGAELIIETLKRLDSESALAMDSMSLWEKFVETRLKVVEDKPAPTRAVKRRQAAKKNK